MVLVDTSTRPAQQPVILFSMAKQPPMTDSEATPFHWWLLDVLKDDLFNPKPQKNENISTLPDMGNPKRSLPAGDSQVAGGEQS
jgi:hypothetical protein